MVPIVISKFQSHWGDQNEHFWENKLYHVHQGEPSQFKPSYTSSTSHPRLFPNSRSFPSETVGGGEHPAFTEHGSATPVNRFAAVAQGHHPGEVPYSIHRLSAYDPWRLHVGEATGRGRGLRRDVVGAALQDRAKNMVSA